MFDLLLSDPLPAVFVGWAKATRRSAAFVATATRVPVDDCAGLVWVDKASATPSWPTRLQDPTQTRAPRLWLRLRQSWASLPVTCSNQQQGANVGSRTHFERGDVKAGVREADIVVEREFRTSWVHQGYLEPQSCSAMFDPLGNVTVYASTQALFHTRRQVAHVLGLG